MIRTVAFDADDTLLDTAAGVRAAMASLVEWLGDPAPTVEQMWADGNFYWNLIPHEQVPAIRAAAFYASLSRVGREAETERVVEYFLKTRLSLTRPFPGVLDMLAALRPRYTLGYATNGITDADVCGLAGQFSFEIYALRTGVPKKPTLAFYEAVAAHAGCEPAEVVYVGDSYEHDVVGPAGFGMRTVWVNRSGAPIPGEVRPDAVIDNLVDLPRILAGWR